MRKPCSTRTFGRLLGCWIMAGALAWLPAKVVLAESEREILAESPAPEEGYAEGGVEACLECHDETDDSPVLGILQTPHATKGDRRSPFGSELGCQSCHGASGEHARKVEGDAARPSVAIHFVPETKAAVQNLPCLGCHQGGDQMHWKGSTHDTNEVACASCHQVHAAEDPMLEHADLRPEIWNRAQADTCFGCHPQQRAQLHRVSAHPLKEGQMRCSDCHNAHGSTGPSLLVRSNVNETCYQCHAEKRGPFLWEHPPAREDCSNCHEPHGSNHPSLLSNRGPYLCQQCHMAPFHPSTAYTAGRLPGPNPADQMLTRHCLNCHTEVHGSNHPSGPRFTR